MVGINPNNSNRGEGLELKLGTTTGGTEDVTLRDVIKYKDSGFFGKTFMKLDFYFNNKGSINSLEISKLIQNNIQEDSSSNAVANDFLRNLVAVRKDLKKENKFSQLSIVDSFFAYYVMQDGKELRDLVKNDQPPAANSEKFEVETNETTDANHVLPEETHQIGLEDILGTDNSIGTEEQINPQTEEEQNSLLEQSRNDYKELLQNGPSIEFMIKEIEIKKRGLEDSTELDDLNNQQKQIIDIVNRFGGASSIKKPFVELLGKVTDFDVNDLNKLRINFETEKLAKLRDKIENLEIELGVESIFKPYISTEQIERENTKKLEEKKNYELDKRFETNEYEIKEFLAELRNELLDNRDDPMIRDFKPLINPEKLITTTRPTLSAISKSIITNKEKFLEKFDQYLEVKRNESSTLSAGQEARENRFIEQNKEEILGFLEHLKKEIVSYEEEQGLPFTNLKYGDIVNVNDIMFGDPEIDLIHNKEKFIQAFNEFVAKENRKPVDEKKSEKVDEFIDREDQFDAGEVWTDVDEYYDSGDGGRSL